jgi:hypothetical protein
VAESRKFAEETRMKIFTAAVLVAIGLAVLLVWSTGGVGLTASLLLPRLLRR